MIWSRVVLPAPFGPSNAQCSPALIVMLTWSSRSWPSRTRSTWSARNTTSASAGPVLGCTAGRAMRPDRTGPDQQAASPDPTSASAHRQAGDERCLVRRQEGDHVGDVGGLAEPPERDRLRQGLPQAGSGERREQG